MKALCDGIVKPCDREAKYAVYFGLPAPIHYCGPHMAVFTRERRAGLQPTAQFAEKYDEGITIYFGKVISTPGAV